MYPGRVRQNVPGRVPKVFMTPERLPTKEGERSLELTRKQAVPQPLQKKDRAMKRRVEGKWSGEEEEEEEGEGEGRRAGSSRRKVPPPPRHSVAKIFRTLVRETSEGGGGEGEVGRVCVNMYVCVIYSVCVCNI